MTREKLKVVTPSGKPVVPGTYVLDEQAGFLMRVAMQRHTSIFTARMVEGLTQTQFAALAKLYEVGPCSQNHLGRLIYLDAATIKGVVDRLNIRGFVTALADTKDRRRRAVALTEHGREVTAAAQAVAAEITRATLEPLTADERSIVLRLLKKLG
ncbi:MAG: MarR family transcriptional regulator [Pseudolabrys sp.]|nr:MarR family transcriptional regulator [Pseudolabrys sp.]